MSREDVYRSPQPAVSAAKGCTSRETRCEAPENLLWNERCARSALRATGHLTQVVSTHPARIRSICQEAAVHASKMATLLRDGESGAYLLKLGEHNADLLVDEEAQRDLLAQSENPSESLLDPNQPSQEETRSTITAMRDRVCRYYLQKRISAPDAEDLAQYVMICGIKQAASLVHHSKEKVERYIWGIARHLLWCYYRRARSVGGWRNRITPSEFVEDTEALDTSLTEVRLVADPDDEGAEPTLFTNAEARLIAQVLDLLSPAERQAIGRWVRHMKRKAFCRAQGIEPPRPFSSDERVQYFRAKNRARELARQLKRCS